MRAKPFRRFHAVSGEGAELVVRVRQGVRQVHKERLRPRPLQELQGPRGDKVGRILLPAVEPVGGQEELVLILPEMLGVIVVRVQLIEVAEEFVEAPPVRHASGGRPAQSPLSEDGGAVAGALQQTRDGGFLIAHPKFRTPVAAHGGVAAVLSGHQRAPGGRANRGPGVGLREARAGGGQAVQVGGTDALLAVAAKISVAQVIGQDEEDVGQPGGGAARHQRRRRQSAAQELPAVHTCWPSRSRYASITKAAAGSPG
jgi:hypothetical protein